MIAATNEITPLWIASCPNVGLFFFLDGTSYSVISMRIFIGCVTGLEEEAPIGTLPVTIPIFNLQKGIVYQLELTNSCVNRLVGEFFVE